MATPKMAVTTIFSVALQLGIAILGRGGFRAFFAEPALVTLAILTAIGTVAALFTTGNLSSGRHEDRSNRWVLVSFTIIGLLLAYLPALTDRLDVWTIDGGSVRWVGIAVVTVGGWLRLWPVFVLGHRFSGLVAIQERHELVTSGPYTYIRHPSYLGLLLSELGWSLTFRSIIGIVLTVLSIFVLVGRMNAEERLLKANFGTDYEAYRQRTSRLLPGIY